MSVSTVTTSASTTASTASTSSTSTSNTSTSQSESLLDTNDFLTLITTQLENQNPLDPTDANEFMNQLMSYATFNQIAEMGAKLDTLSETMTTMSRTVTSLYEAYSKSAA